MPKTIISDTSCLIVLSNINELELLHKVYREIITTQEVAEEFGEPLPEWIKIMSAKNKTRQIKLEEQLDKGEASAITLALEIPKSIIILDDFKARIVAEKLGLEFTGTLGIMIKAKKNGIINSIKPYLKKLKNANFRISEELEDEILKESDEQ